MGRGGLVCRFLAGGESKRFAFGLRGTSYMRTSRRMLKQVRSAFAIAFVFSGFINVLMLATPLYTLQVFETVVPLGSIETLVILTLITGAAILALALIEVVRDIILARSALWLDQMLGQFMLENGLKAGTTSSDMRRDMRALDTLRGFISSSAVTPFFDGPWVPIFLLALALLHPLIGMLGLVAVGALFTAALLQAALTERLQQEAQQARERSNQWWGLATGNVSLAGALGLARGVAERWELANRGHTAGGYSLAKRSSLVKALARSVRIGSQVAVYALGAWLVINDQVSPGVLVASAILLARALAPLEQLVGAIKPAMAAWRAYRRLKALPDDFQQVAVGASDAETFGKLRLHEVTHYMPGRKAPALRGVNLDLAPGASLAIVGPNGSGKSTLAAVISGAIVPTTGNADLDGIAVARWQRSMLHPPVGYMPDEPMLVEGSVHENIVRFSSDSLMTAVAAAVAAGVHDRLQCLPNGYETEVGPSGAALSLGERRAVALARAVSCKPKILVLDEPEAGLDGAGIRHLVRALEDLKGKSVSLVLATQDPRLLRLVDTVVVMSAGAITRIAAPADMLPHAVAAEVARTNTPNSGIVARPIAPPVAG